MSDDVSGPVRLKNPKNVFLAVGDHGMHGTLDTLRHAYFGLFISDGQRSLIGKLDLKKRSYLGPTSLVPELALLMANQARVTSSSLVVDPFVGTGSIIVAAAQFGAVVLGSDIDVRVLRGKQGNNITTMLRQYGLPAPELMRVDNAAGCARVRLYPQTTHTWDFGLQPSADWRVLWWCAAVAGIATCGTALSSTLSCATRRTACERVRERQACRSASRRRSSAGRRTSSPRWCTTRWTYVAVLRRGVLLLPLHRDEPTAARPRTAQVMRDLLDMAARNLVVGGRLVYLLPSTSEYTDAEVPVHPCLAVEANSEQKLGQYFSRRLITMRKVRRRAVSVSRC